MTSTKMEMYGGLPVTHMGKECPSLRQKYKMNVSLMVGQWGEWRILGVYSFRGLAGCDAFEGVCIF